LRRNGNSPPGADHRAAHRRVAAAAARHRCDRADRRAEHPLLLGLASHATVIDKGQIVYTSTIEDMKANDISASATWHCSDGEIPLKVGYHKHIRHPNRPNVDPNLCRNAAFHRFRAASLAITLKSRCCAQIHDTGRCAETIA
jgi:hypothetical protein